LVCTEVFSISADKPKDLHTDKPKFIHPKTKIMKFPVLSIALALVVFSTIFSCRPADSNSNSDSNSGSASSGTTGEYLATHYIELKKDPCFGFCPVYKIKITGDGKAVYNGKKNVEKEGVWYRTLSAEQTKALFKAFEEADYWSFRDEYTAQVTDLPTTWTTFSLGEKNKTIKDYYGAPKELKALEEMVAQIAEEEDGWKHDTEGN
jgi:hypothetical protein